jgi:hypothetical protein
MTRPMRFSSWPIALLIVAGCAPQSDFSAVSTSPVTMMCDGGQTFTVAYANNFETAVIETEGERLELPRRPTAWSMTGTLPESDRGSELDTASEFDTGSMVGPFVGGSTGVRYGSDEALFISRNEGAVLQVGDDNYSNCQVART